MSTLSRLVPPEPSFAELFTRKRVTVPREGYDGGVSPQPRRVPARRMRARDRAQPES
jgi:hypothetical protein